MTRYRYATSDGLAMLLKEKREEKGWSLRDAEKETGFDKGLIQRLEAGSGGFRKAIEYATALGVKIYAE